MPLTTGRFGIYTDVSRNGGAPTQSSVSHLEMMKGCPSPSILMYMQHTCVCCKNCLPFVATVASVNHTNSILELNINHMPMPLLLKPNMRSHTFYSISYLFILFILSGSMAFSFPRWCLWGWERWFLWEGKADRLEVYLSLDMGRSHH